MVVKGVKILSNYIISSYSLSKQLHWDGSTSEESSPPVFLIDPVSTIALYSFSNISLERIKFDLCFTEDAANFLMLQIYKIL